MEQPIGVDSRTGDGLGQMSQPDEHEEDKRDGRQQGVECERARQEGDVALVGGLQGAAKEAGG